MEGELLRVRKLQTTENWSLWKFQVRVILKAPGAWEVTNGQATRPVAPEAGAPAAQLAEHQTKLEKWNKLDGLAQKIIVTTIKEQPMIHIINCENSKSMWDKLVAVYEQKSAATIHMLQQKWFTEKK